MTVPEIQVVRSMSSNKNSILMLWRCCKQFECYLQVVNDPNYPNRKFCFSFCHKGECYDCKVNFFNISSYSSSDKVSVTNMSEDKWSRIAYSLQSAAAAIHCYLEASGRNYLRLSLKDSVLCFQVNTDFSIAFSESRTKPRLQRCLSGVSELVVGSLVNFLIQFSCLYSLSYTHRHIHMHRKSCLGVLPGVSLCHYY